MMFTPAQAWTVYLQLQLPFHDADSNVSILEYWSAPRFAATFFMHPSAVGRTLVCPL